MINKTAVLGGLVGVIILLGAILGYGYYSDSQEHKAQILLSQAQSYFAAGEFELALKGDDTSYTPGFESIIANFSRTKAANLARYYASISEYNLGNFDMALAYINKFDIPDGVLGVNPLAFKGSLLNQLGDHKKVAETYEEAANQEETVSTTPLYLVEAAKAYIASGDKAKASKIIELVLQKYPTGSHAIDAQRLKGALS